jgi:hypothetical protein
MFGWPAKEDFLSAAVTCGAIARTGCVEMPGLELPPASFVAATIEAEVGAGALELGVSAEVRDGAGLSARLLVLLNPASGEPAACAVALVKVADVGAGSAAAELAGIGSPGTELSTLASPNLGSADRLSIGDSIADTELLPPTEAGSAGIGGWAENVSGKMLEAEFVGRAGLGLSADEKAG